MMQFAESGSSSFGARRESGFWRGVIYVAAAVGALAAIQPWIRVRFVRLFGEVFGPPAWQSSVGFTCLCTCALVAVMALAETQTRTAQKAVRPASLMLAVVMSLALALHVLKGPGSLRGVTATWTVSMYFGLAGAGAVLLACVMRFRRYRRGPSAHG